MEDELKLKQTLIWSIKANPFEQLIDLHQDNNVDEFITNFNHVSLLVGCLSKEQVFCWRTLTRDSIEGLNP
jgi:hypothetical protein